MIYKQNIHTHTTFCDGKDTPEEMVLHSIKIGHTSIGFSAHSYAPFSPYPSMNEEKTVEYIKEINYLKEKYKDKTEIFLGLEFEMYSPVRKENYDYVIGSTHYLKIGNEYVGFDRDAKIVKNIIDTYFSGNGLKYAKAYYETFSQLSDFGNFDIVGHFDLITKHSEKENFFDTESKEYINYAFDALYTLKEKFDIYEVNTGAISRGYRTTPYPSEKILKEMKKIGCKMIITSDCHDKNYLDNYFDESLQLLKACGFSEVYTLEKNGFKGHKI